ncbi:hypothetical protein HYX15_02710 [Candidatus Woesearchaeota archaeon]|nr:hypothetical protein [Candidatus Woesearchaeota archaeon]
MKLTKFSLIVSFLIVIYSMTILSFDERCNEFDIFIHIKAFDEKNFEELSEYQLPDFKEGDSIRIWRLTVINNGNCISDNQTINMNIKSPEREIEGAFCLYSLKIPPINPGETYSIYYSNISSKVIGNTKIYGPVYDDSQNNTIDGLCEVNLDSVGLWTINTYLEPGGGSYGFSFLDDNNFGGNRNFKVRDKLEVNTLKQQQRTLFLSFWAIFITGMVGIGTILTQYFVTKLQIKDKKEKDNSIQDDLLKSIETQLRLISRSVNGQKKLLNANPTVIPSYFISELDKNFYITNIRSKVKNHDTEILKEWIGLVSDKILNINRLVQLSQEFYSTESYDITNNPYVKELKDKDYKYHTDLEYLIKKLREELNKIRYQLVSQH